MSNIPTSLSFEHVLFFGRSLLEYEAMFGIDMSQWQDRKVLDCPSGPSSFVAECRQKGVQAFGCDPMYENGLEHLTKFGIKDIDTFLSSRESSSSSIDSFLYKETGEYRQKRLNALNLFLQDYKKSLHDSRYFAAQLPHIPYPDKSFELVLSANFLFVYSDLESGGFLTEPTFDFNFHLEAILELYRLCSKEVRIYPLKGPNKEEHPYLPKLIESFKKLNITTQLKTVIYQGIIGADETLILQKS